MKTIKFRAWDQHKKVMVSWEEIWECKGYVYDFFNNIFNNLIPLQRTGLKDQNGYAIYEGDIITTHRNGEGIRRTGEVVYDNEVGAYYMGEWGMLSDFSLFNEFRIIGNNFENPELLNKDSHR